jgi:4-amino-4-deoxy-L-arabinose transferase-like glycosyltransferase
MRPEEQSFGETGTPSQGSQPGPAQDGPTRRDFVLHEYDAVKAEMTAAVSAQHTIMTYALAGAAAVFTGLLATWDEPALRVALLALGPLFLVMVWFVWYGEIVRMARAGRYIWELEKLVNADFAGGRAPDSRRTPVPTDLDPAEVLHWEGWVRGNNRWQRSLHISESYVLATGLLHSMAVFATTLSLVFALTSDGIDAAIRVLPFFVAPVVVLFVAIAVRAVGTNPLLRRG